MVYWGLTQNLQTLLWKTIYILKEDKIIFEKTKKFCKEHKTVLTIGGTVVLVVGGIIIGKKLSVKMPARALRTVGPVEDCVAEKEFLESFGAVYEEGYYVPFATKEVAIKFMEEVGNIYQIDRLDDLTSVIWITNHRE